VGVGTVIADDPLLTSRIKGGRDPLKLIVDSTLRIPLQSKVFHSGSSRTVVATSSDDTARIRDIEALGAEVLQCKSRDGRVDLHDLMLLLGGRGVQSILLEGGAILAGAMLHARLIDRCIFFYAPRLLGGEGVGLFAGAAVERMADALPLEKISVKRCGDDIMIEGDPIYPCLPV
jgi:diaminohydroxyphosphoribosylaminopyrimidine deaminase/5-amino-6-(5-phosphoribosylamino)uracil reductase